MPAHDHTGTAEIFTTTTTPARTEHLCGLDEVADPAHEQLCLSIPCFTSRKRFLTRPCNTTVAMQSLNKNLYQKEREDFPKEGDA